MTHDTSAETAEPFFGDKLYQQRARRALPILVRQAVAGQSLYYADLAGELEMPNPRNLNYVLGCIGQTLLTLGEQRNQEIPPIQCLVVNQDTGLPGEGVGWFIDKSDFKHLTTKQKRSVIDFQLHRIFSFNDWYSVLSDLGLESLPNDHKQIIDEASRFKAGGESEHHRALKDAIAANPQMIGLPVSVKPGETEFQLPSGDSVDVLFRHRNTLIGVEVKSHVSDNPDITRGLFQCVKYQAVIEAMLACDGKPQNVRVLLALDQPLPDCLTSIRCVLGVEVVDVAERAG